MAQAAVGLVVMEGGKLKEVGVGNQNKPWLEKSTLRIVLPLLTELRGGYGSRRLYRRASKSGGDCRGGGFEIMGNLMMIGLRFCRLRWSS